MDKKSLLFIPFIIGIVLFAYSWYESFPLAINGSSDFIYNHISIFYWYSLPLLLGSMFLIAITFKNRLLKLLFSVGIILLVYSTAYFYTMLPSADSNYFRGLTEYFISTNSLNPTVPSHEYYQWPSFFILRDISTMVSGLALASFEFILYIIIGALIAIALFFYTPRKNEFNAFLIVIGFSISMFYFFNFQAVPFTLAFGLLLLIFALESRPKSTPILVVTILLYVSTLLTHAFVPLFLVVYFFIRSILDRSKRYGQLFVFSLVAYLVVQFTIANVSFAQNILNVMTQQGEYSQLVAVSFTSITAPLDVTAQFFSRIVTIGSLGLCVFGFVFMLFKRKLRSVDKGILITGILYSGLGLVLNTLGSRGIALAFVPVALGVVYLFNSRFKRILIAAFFIFLILFVFIPIHQSFSYSIQFQTNESYLAENFFISHYNWEKPVFVLSNFWVTAYITARAGVGQHSFTDNIGYLQYIGAVMYTVALKDDLHGQNSSLAQIESTQNFDTVYSNGISSILIKPQ